MPARKKVAKKKAPAKKTSTKRASDERPSVHLATRAAWRKWLQKNHAASTGVWLIFDKRSAGRERLPYADAVEEALCFGWIDSVVQPISAEQYRQLFTPRKPKSNWSKLNKERVARLLEAGLVAPAGMAAIEAGKRHGSWSALDRVEALEMPDDLVAALEAAGDPPGAAARNFAAFSMSVRKAYLYWIREARRPETRAKRVAEVARRAAANLRTRFLTPPPT